MFLFSISLHSAVHFALCRLDFSQFLRAVQRQKRTEHVRTYKEADIVGAFTAVGGNADKSGSVSLVNLQKILKVRHDSRSPLRTTWTTNDSHLL